MKRKGDEGQILVTVALGLVVLIGVMALAMDMGYLRYMKRKIQAAADAAATAGALQLSSCTGGCDTAITTAAQTASSENGFANGAKGVTVAISHPPAAGDPYSNAGDVVEVTISQPEPIQFAKILGIGSATVSARADAKTSSSINCVYSLNTLAVVAGAVDAPNCGIVVEQSLDCAVGSINALRVGVVGASGGLLCTTPRPIRIGMPQRPTRSLTFPLRRSATAAQRRQAPTRARPIA